MITSSYDIKSKQGLELPAIFKSINTNTIVLFFREHDGIVISAGHGNEVVGERYDEFISCFNGTTWEAFHGSITLTQE